VAGWVPFKVVSDSPALHSRWLLLLKIEISKEIYIISNSSHLEWRAGLSDIILKGSHLGTITARFGLIWFCGFRGEDLNVIFYQNMPNLHNRYKSAERKNFTEKNKIFVKLLLAM
jgi:hypothetical protein